MRTVRRYIEEAEAGERQARLLTLLSTAMERLVARDAAPDREIVDFGGDLPVTTTDAQPGGAEEVPWLPRA